MALKRKKKKTKTNKPKRSTGSSMIIKNVYEITKKDIKEISNVCRNYAYNGLGVSCEAGWHPVTLENAVKLIQKYYQFDKKLNSMALDILITLAMYYLMFLQFETKYKPDELLNKYTTGYKCCLLIYGIISSEKMKGCIFDSCIRINTLYTLLCCAQMYCDSNKAAKGTLKISYCLSRYIERYYQKSIHKLIKLVEQKDNVNEEGNQGIVDDDPCLFGSNKEYFSTAYCNSVSSYYGKLCIFKLNENETVLKKEKILKRINIAWDFINRELIHIYNQKKIALLCNPKWKYYADEFVKCFIPNVIKDIIGMQCRIYCVLKNDNYGIDRFFQDINNQIKCIPIPPNDGEAYEGFRILHKQINEQLCILHQNSFILMHMKNIPWAEQNQNDHQYQLTLKYAALSQKIFNIFKSKKKILFLKNFLHGKKCGYCETNKKRLKLCSRCKKTLYCSTKCQKLHWLQHKLLC